MTQALSVFIEMPHVMLAGSASVLTAYLPLSKHTTIILHKTAEPGNSPFLYYLGKAHQI